MWDRKVLKETGKDRFRANRFTCILAGLLLSIVSGGGGYMGSGYNSEQSMDQLDLPPEVIRITIIVFGCLAIAGIVLSIFLFSPLEVGLRSFFLQNSKKDEVGLGRNNVGLAFSEGNYTNVVAAMFMTRFFIFLWSMLFLVPGIIKSYAWRMVPYIIAEEPQITGTEARMKSAQMMYGSKWESFILDLSFIGWYMLGIITIGIGNLVWTNPYKAAADAELYRTLNGDPSAPSYAVSEALEKPVITEVESSDTEIDKIDKNDDDDIDITFVK